MGGSCKVFVSVVRKPQKQVDKLTNYKKYSHKTNTTLLDGLLFICLDRDSAFIEPNQCCGSTDIHDLQRMNPYDFSEPDLPSSNTSRSKFSLILWNISTLIRELAVKFATHHSCPPQD